MTNGRTISANAKQSHAATADAPYTVHRPKRASTRLGDPRETLAKPWKSRLVVHGITTDGSTLYPEPIQQVFGDVPHQICAFHVIAELTKAVLGAVAKVRKSLAGRKPKLSRGRPSKRARKVARQSKRIGQNMAELFEHRHLFVKHHLSPAEQKTLQHITRGLPQLRTLRQIMDEAYRLFDSLAAAQTPPWPNWHGCAAA